MVGMCRRGRFFVAPVHTWEDVIADFTSCPCDNPCLIACSYHVSNAEIWLSAGMVFFVHCLILTVPNADSGLVETFIPRIQMPPMQERDKECKQAIRHIQHDRPMYTTWVSFT